MTKNVTKGRGRPKTGSLYETKSGWSARITVQVDGVSVQRSFDLGTTDRAAAKAKLRRLAKDAAPPSKERAAALVTVAEFAEQWIARRESQKIAATDYERRYLERIWIPRIGALPLERVSVADVQEALDDCISGKLMPAQRLGQKAQPKPYGRQSVVHIRNTVIGLFKSAERNELVKRNVAALTEVPAEREGGLHKVRTTLTDAELGQLLACPSVDPEIKVLTLIARTVGGLRTGDLNSLCWTQFSPNFETLSFVRRKTKKKRPHQEVHAVPEVVRAFIAEWHERSGSPTEGPVFPVRKGPRAGKTKVGSNISYAERLRSELLKAGVDRRELHHETATTKATDFHSLRRRFAQALLETGVNAQTAMQLTGHSDPKVHQVYADSHNVRVLPAAAVPLLNEADALTLRRVAPAISPNISIGAARIRRLNQPANSNPAFFSERDKGLEPSTSSLGSSCSTN